uniref:Transmembrane protein n=1 Tax=Panagrellus redivivus TaxID=6233 RepID=A0A7E4VRL5_PANRE
MFSRSFSTARSKRSTTKQSFTEKANAWIIGKWGRRFRIGLLAGTVVVYPVGYLITHGPLHKYFFEKNHSVDFNLPEHLQRLTLEELEKFQEMENRKPKNTIIDFGIQKNLESLDSIASGSLGVRFGAQVGLPFYAQFQSKDDALDYCQKNLPTLDIFGQKVPIIWDSPAGNELLDTFVLSPNALRFVILRDMFANDGYNAYANKAISWSTWTAFTSIFTYWLHQKTRMCGGTAKSFAVVYCIFLIFALVAHEQWFLLYRFLADTHGDSVASRVTFDYSSGGKEYYWKMLKRNRILRDLLVNGREHITPVGDLRSITTRLLVRYDLLKDVGIEDDEVRGAMRGDD